MDNEVEVAATISDYIYIALATGDLDRYLLHIYCASTGWNIVRKTRASALWSASGGHDIRYAAFNKANVSTITQDALDCTMAVVDTESGSWE